MSLLFSLESLEYYIVIQPFCNLLFITFGI